MLVESEIHLSVNRMELHTTRLWIRPFNKGDLAPLTPILSDPQTMAFIGNGPLNSQEIGEQLEQWIFDFEKEGFGFMAFIEKSSGALIGYGGFLHQTIEGELKIELGYVIGKPYWRQGFAFEAASALKDLGLNTLKMDELISIIHEANVASQKLAVKLKMELKKQIVIDGEPCLVYYSTHEK